MGEIVGRVASAGEVKPSILSMGQDDKAGEHQQNRDGDRGLEVVPHELLSCGADKESPGWTGGLWRVLGVNAYLLKLNWVILPLPFTSQ